MNSISTTTTRPQQKERERERKGKQKFKSFPLRLPLLGLVLQLTLIALALYLKSKAERTSLEIYKRQIRESKGWILPIPASVDISHSNPHPNSNPNSNSNPNPSSSKSQEDKTRTRTRIRIDEPIEEISLWLDETKHFQLDEFGVGELAAYLPIGRMESKGSRRDFFELGGQDKEVGEGEGGQMMMTTTTTTMFHRLECLQLIQDALARVKARYQSQSQSHSHSSTPTPSNHHDQTKRDSSTDTDTDTDIVDACANYLWKSVLCTANTRLEYVWHPSNVSWVAAPPQAYRCRDWTVVYDAFENSH